MCVYCLDSRVNTVTPSIQGNPPGGRCSPIVAGKICPIIGDVVTITCDTSYADSYVISGPNQRTSINTPLTFTTTSADAGTYTCMSINDCKNNTGTATLESCKSVHINNWRHSLFGHLGRPGMVEFEVSSTGEDIVTERCLEKFQNLPQTLRLRCRPDLDESGVFYYFFHNDQFIPREENDTIDLNRQKSLLTGNYTCRMDSPCGTFYASTIFTEGKILYYDILITFI